MFGRLPAARNPIGNIIAADAAHKNSRRVSFDPVFPLFPAPITFVASKPDATAEIHPRLCAMPRRQNGQVRKWPASPHRLLHDGFMFPSRARPFANSPQSITARKATLATETER